MQRILSQTLNIAIPVFAVSSMLTVGFRYTVRQVIEPLRDLLGVVTALVANFVFVPSLAYGILLVLPLDRPFAIGLILCATAAGAPVMIKLAGNAGQDVAFAAAILILLLIVTMAYMPLVVPYLAAGQAIETFAIARPLLMTMLLPLGIALVFRATAPQLAERLLPIAGWATTIALWTMVALTLVLNFNAVLGVVGTGAIIASLLFIGGAFSIGYLIGTFDKKEKIVLAFGTAQRNFAAAIVVATLAFDDDRVLVMTVVVSTVAMLLLPLSSWIGRCSETRMDGDAAPVKE